MILCIFFMGIHTRNPLSAWRRAWYSTLSSANLVVNVIIEAIPKYCPTQARLNQGWSSVPTSISISFRLNSSDLLLLEAFNKERWEDIFFYILKLPTNIIFCQSSKSTDSLDHLQLYTTKVLLKIFQYLRSFYMFLFKEYKLKYLVQYIKYSEIFCITIIANKCTVQSVFYRFLTHNFVTNVSVFMSKLITFDY